MNPSSAAGRQGILLALLAILAVGGALRMTNLSNVPPGLWFDEALNGQDAADVWKPGGHFKIVYPDVFPREPMFETVLALATRVLGPRVETLRLCSALAGLAAIILIWAAVRGEWGEGPALAGAGALASMRWHAIFSRLVFRTIVLPAWISGLVWAALALRRKPTPARAVALGIMLGGGFYTYLAWYLMLPLVAGIMIWLCRPLRPANPAARWGALSLLIGACVAAPILLHYYFNAEDFSSRPEAVSPFSGKFGDGLKEIAKNALQALGMFHFRGDHVPKQNIPHAPGLDPLQGMLMIIGLAICVLKIRRTRDALSMIALGWLFCGVLPTVFAKTDSPNFLRTLVVTPAAAIMIGLGIEAAARYSSGKLGRGAGIAAAISLILISAAWSGWDIFGVWARRADVWEGFNGAEASLARGLQAAPPGTIIFVPGDIYAHRSFKYIAGGRAEGSQPEWRPYADFAPLRLAPGEAGETRWVVATAHNGFYQALRALAPGGADAHEFKAPAGNTWAIAYAIPPGALPNADKVKAAEKEWRGELSF